MAQEVYIAVGRRKTSVARVRLWAGKGDIKVNRKSVEDFTGRETLREEIVRPLKLVEKASQVNIMANVRGGGITGQAGAITHGIARALLEMDPSLRAVLKKD